MTCLRGDSTEGAGHARSKGGIRSEAVAHPGEEAVQVSGRALRQVSAAPGQRHERGVHQEVGVGLPPAALVLAAPCAEARHQL